MSQSMMGSALTSPFSVAPAMDKRGHQALLSAAGHSHLLPHPHAHPHAGELSDLDHLGMQIVGSSAVSVPLPISLPMAAINSMGAHALPLLEPHAHAHPHAVHHSLGHSHPHPHPHAAVLHGVEPHAEDEEEAEEEEDDDGDGDVVDDDEQDEHGGQPDDEEPEQDQDTMSRGKRKRGGPVPSARGSKRRSRNKNTDE